MLPEALTMFARPGQLASGRRRGAAALALAFTLMLVVFTMLFAYTLDLTANALQVRNAWAADQALYAAEAGIDVALQTGASRPITGHCGRGVYAASVLGDTVTGLGAVELPSGKLVRRAVQVTRGGDGSAARGSWRQIPAARAGGLVPLIDAVWRRTK